MNFLSGGDNSTCHIGERVTGLYIGLTHYGSSIYYGNTYHRVNRTSAIIVTGKV